MTSSCTSSALVQPIMNEKNMNYTKACDGVLSKNHYELQSTKNLVFTTPCSARFLSHRTDTSAFTPFQSTKSNYVAHYNFHYRNALKYFLKDKMMHANVIRNPNQMPNLTLPNQIPSANNITPPPVLSNSTALSKSGLDMLGSIASIEYKMPHQNDLEQQQRQQQRNPPNTIEQFCNQQNNKNKGTSKNGHRNRLIYIDKVRDSDVLCGRGGKSNNHSGNKQYRRVIDEMKITYKNTEQKLKKTDLSRHIVDYVYKYGGRFVKKEISTGKHYLLTKTEARRKTSQALREQKKINGQCKNKRFTHIMK